MTHTTNFRRGLCLLLACLFLSLGIIAPITAYAATYTYEDASEAGAEYEWKYTFYANYTYTNPAGVTYTNYFTVIVWTDGEAYVNPTHNNTLHFPIPSVVYEYTKYGNGQDPSVYWWKVTNTNNDSVEYVMYPFTEWKKEPNGTSSDDGSGGNGSGDNGSGDNGSGTDMTETNNWLQKIYNAITGLASSITTPIKNALQTVKTAIVEVKGVAQDISEFLTGTSYVDSPTKALKFGSLFDLFPFNIPKGIYDTISFWEANAAPPVITVPLPNYAGGGVDVYEFEINLSEIPGMDALAALIRAGELILFAVGLVILTEKVTKW